MKPITSYEKLEDLGRVRLSRNFFMRDFLYSEIAGWHGNRKNTPDHPDKAIEVGTRLCEELLEPLQATFGRVHVRSGYRSPQVNQFGNENSLNCASNEANFARHIWDYPDKDGKRGATACIVLPWLVDHIERGGKWTDMAWWIHDHLPYNTLYFFPRLAAFNISWHEAPQRRIDSYVEPKGCLTRPGMPNHPGLHAAEYVSFPELQQPLLNAERSPSEPSRQEGPAPRVALSLSGELKTPAVQSVPHSETTTTAPGRIRYRAVHSKTLWRKVSAPHASLENALFGRDGAAGLFARKVRIDYEKHGDPLYALVWQDGASHGYVVKADGHHSSGIQTIEVPVARLLEFERAGGCDLSTLDKIFGGNT